METEVTASEPKRGPGRPPKAEKVVADEGCGGAKRCATIIYRPIEDGDKPFAVWNGVRFEANVPVEIPHDRPASGERISGAEMIALAKGNPWFTVDGERTKRVRPTAPPVPPAGTDVPAFALDDSKMVELDE